MPSRDCFAAIMCLIRLAVVVVTVVLLVPVLLVIAIPAIMLIMLYPERRVCTWFEIFTDGWMPDIMSHMAQDTLTRMWQDGFQRGIVQVDSQVSNTLAEYLRDASCSYIIDLAAGGGMASSMWAQELRGKGVEVNVILTDLQPNLRAWECLQTSFGPHITFINKPVDATDLQGSLQRAGMSTDIACEGLRTINLSLHHFRPELVRGLLQDVIQAKSAILISDLAPKRGGVLCDWAVTCKHALSLSAAEMQAYLPNMQWWTPLFLPFVYLMASHDATVSVLRAYSASELFAMVDTIPGGERYRVSVFKSASCGKWLGLPSALNVSVISDPYIQHIFIAPCHSRILEH